MLKSYKDIEKQLACFKSKPEIVVCAGHDEEPIMACKKAVQKKLCNVKLIGDKKKILAILKKKHISGDLFTIINSDDQKEIIEKSIIEAKKGGILMKGLIQTPDFMKGILSKEAGIKKDTIVSHCFVFENTFSRKLTILTDAGIVPYPDLTQKMQILDSALELADVLGCRKKHVALISASEKITDKIPSTLDFQKIKEIYSKKKGIVIDGPFGIDVAITKLSAKHKGIDTPVSQKGDIWLVPNVEAGNMAAKSIMYFGKVVVGGVLMGTKIPIVLLSRSDTALIKYNSILLSLLCLRRKYEK